MKQDIRGVYEHYKGGDYEVLGIALHEETHEEMVVYRPLYEIPELGPNPMFVRPKNIFFEKVKKNGMMVDRFTHKHSAV
jgi:hypothetical protein